MIIRVARDYLFCHLMSLIKTCIFLAEGAELLKAIHNTSFVLQRIKGIICSIQVHTYQDTAAVLGAQKTCFSCPCVI